MTSNEKIQNADVNICPQCVCNSPTRNRVDWMLICAASLDHVPCLNACLAAGARVNRSDVKGYTALMRACEKGHDRCVDILLKSGSWINKKNRLGDTALICAVANSHRKCADLIIEAGANVNRENTNMDRALAIAAWNGSPECTDLLIKAGADVNSKNHYDTTALMFAASRGYHDCINALIDAGADVNGVDIYGEAPLFYALSGDRTRIDTMVECLRSLLQAGANVNVDKVPGHNCEAKIAFLKKLHLDPNNLQMVIDLLLAAGEELVGEELPDTPAEINLSHLCRASIRKHLLLLDRHENLFVRVPRLGLPAVLTEYVLFTQKLQNFESNDTIEDAGYSDNHQAVFLVYNFEIVLSHCAWM